MVHNLSTVASGRCVYIFRQQSGRPPLTDLSNFANICISVYGICGYAAHRYEKLEFRLPVPRPESVPGGPDPESSNISTTYPQPPILLRFKNIAMTVYRAKRIGEPAGR